MLGVFGERPERRGWSRRELRGEGGKADRRIPQGLVGHPKLKALAFAGHETGDLWTAFSRRT